MRNRHTKPCSSALPRNLVIAGAAYPVMDMLFWPHWREMARQKGFELFARVKDKDHLALKCHKCGEHTLVKVFNLRTAQPQCHPCRDAGLSRLAQKAGTTMIRRCPKNTQYLWLQLPCGHKARRQTEMVARVARGEVKFLCKTCLMEREVDEARERGWERLGRDPDGNPNYRLYRHCCGHRQRVTRRNMQTGRFTCGGCALAWTAAPSALYLLRITLPDARVLMKLGMSRDPVSRMRYQLPRHHDVQLELLDTVDMASGSEAQVLEKGLHTRLKARYPQHVVPREIFEAHLKVTSEIYAPELEPHLRRILKRARRRAT